MTTRQLRFSQVRYFMAVYVINRSWYELVHDMVVWWYESSKYFSTLEEKFHISSRPYSTLFFQLRKLYLLTFLHDSAKHAFSVLGRPITEETTPIFGKILSSLKRCLLKCRTNYPYFAVLGLFNRSVSFAGYFRVVFIKTKSDESKSSSVHCQLVSEIVSFHRELVSKRRGSKHVIESLLMMMITYLLTFCLLAVSRTCNDSWKKPRSGAKSVYWSWRGMITQQHATLTRKLQELSTQLLTHTSK